MKKRLYTGLVLITLVACGDETVSEAPAGTVLDGFVDIEWVESTGRLMLHIESFDTPFIYQSALARGIGSNDIGLDRGQLGATRLARFIRSGSKVLLMQDNLDYRALTDNNDERAAVAESFAASVLWGFDVAGESGGVVKIDGTDFFLSDVQGLSDRLTAIEEGTYTADANRSVIFMPRTKAFPDNTEVEAIVTFTGKPTGEHLPTVAPDTSSLTVHLHHSFIRLPEDGYEPLLHDPRAGIISLEYQKRGFIDYASPIGSDVYVNYSQRHRLEKKNPAADVSEAVEPIVYYVDRGAPEPVRTALIEGASWWNQAFEAAGYRDAFQVKLLPDDADPMDVRYNVIQWVHRSTRGWSYGSSVMDPRTGEILKGHVTLGSLRVRQDYMIAEGLLAPYSDENVPNDMLDMSLARIRQLSAHEVGHTIGFEHNFAASTQNRASVMDYPFPLVTFDEQGELDLSEAYATGIGEWDKRTVIYAYQDFPEGVNANTARKEIMRETILAGFKYVADTDSRAIGSAHPDGNLWDNGDDAIVELEHLLNVRQHALQRFSEANIRFGRSEATLEEVLVPIYLLHRFQLHAVGKLIGGQYYNYEMRGDGQPSPRPVSPERQRQAIRALIATLDSRLLRLPDGLAGRIPPRPPDMPRGRETFKGATGVTFDPLAPAASAVALTLEVLLDPVRAARMNRMGAPKFNELLNQLLSATWYAVPVLRDGNADLRMQTRQVVLDALLRLAVNEGADDFVRADTLAVIDSIYRNLESASAVTESSASERLLTRKKIERVWADPASIAGLPTVTVPPGSPIGADNGRF
ncbi:MAG: DUF5117 domain-containing protein [Woeseiaceae bacterium]|nr:DUF5117 domain-containing protein [Woeseiaceae bacterium]